jgi:UrcA family protein
MNSATRRLPIAISALALVAGLFPLASMTAHADSMEGYAPPTLAPQVTAPNIAGARAKVVSYADLNLSHPEGVMTLNSRIMSAASSVCPHADTRDLRALGAEAQCRKAAIADANAQVRAQTERLAAR